MGAYQWPYDLETRSRRCRIPREFWETMRKCSAKLPDRLSTVFMLREMEELRAEKSAAFLQISETNLGVMLHRARMAMRECLELNWFGKGKK